MRVFLDLSRTLSRTAHLVPTAIDRVVMAISLNGLLGFYGEQQSSPPETFATLRFTDKCTTYAFRSAGRENGSMQDLAIEALANWPLALQAATT